jgi:hypothetical protein
VIGWGDSTSGIAAVTDTAGNIYKLAVGATRSTRNASQAIYYAGSIAASRSNTVKAIFNATVPAADIRIAEYRGIQAANPLDVAAGAGDGTDTMPTNASITTGNANDLLVAGDLVDASGAGRQTSAGTQAAPGYTARLGTNDGNILEDRIVSSAGPYQIQSASANGGGIVQVAAFKLAGGGNTNTQALSAPSNLSATASGAQINLRWTPASDNIGVTGYLVERCRGAGCVDFIQIASVTDTNYPDTGPLTPSASYAYRVRATDVANLRSEYSNTATATPADP